MPEEPAYVIIGASLAGAKAAETLREEGFTGAIVLLGAELERPYERPPLSKGYLLGKADKASLYVHEEHWYADHQVDLRLGVTATAIDRAASGSRWAAARLEGGASIPYDRLLLATGAQPRRLDVPGGDLDGVHYLRTAADSEALATALAVPPGEEPGGHRGRRLDRPGGRRRGAGEGLRGDRAGAGADPAEPGHRPGTRRGVRRAAPRARGGVPVRRRGQRTARPGRAGHRGGHLRRAPNCRPTWSWWPSARRPTWRWPRRPAWRSSNGVLADAALRTSDPDIFAAGDVANVAHPLLGRRVRVEHWANALHGGPAAARVHARPAGVLRPGAVLLQRPVRAGHGVLRAARAGDLRPGGVPG